MITGLASSFLGQNLKSNTFELEYDFNKRVSAHIGYLYTNRTIAQFSDTNDSELIYFPGGAGAQPRRMISLPRAAAAPKLPAFCRPGARSMRTAP